MFGRRNDGIDISREVDPMVLFTPLAMPTRCESMVHITYPAEYEPMADYIKKNKDSANGMSFLTIIAAAYARSVYYYPVLNYFIGGRRIYRHNDLTISMTILKDSTSEEPAEDLAKIHLEPTDTIFQVTEKVNAEIAKIRSSKEEGGASDFAGKLLRLPVLPVIVMWLFRTMDRLGIVPKALRGISPFHCSLYITNLMSIGLPHAYHHLYNFRTCSIFMSLGKPERQVVTSGGAISRKFMLPLGFVTDERVCGGVEYARGVHCFLNYLKHPELLELTIEEEEALKNK